MDNNLNNVNMYNNVNQIEQKNEPINNEKKKSSNKIEIIIIILLIIIIAILIGIIVRLSMKINSLKQQIPVTVTDVEKLDKIEKEINKKYVEKDYALTDGSILIEIENKSNYGANADVKVELMDEKKNIIDVIDVYISGINSKEKGYGLATMWEANYSSYKVTTNMLPATSLRFHNKDVSIISENVSENSYIVQYKNKASEKLDSLEIGVLFYDKKNNIIGYSSNIESNIEAGSTSSMKIRMPIDEEYENIKYTKAKTIIIGAYTYGDS